MSDELKVGYGVTFERETDVADTYAAIAEVIDTGGPNPSLDTFDASDTESADAWKEKGVGMLDAGQVTVLLGFLADDDGLADLYGDQAAREPHNYQIVNNDDSETIERFSAYVVNIEKDRPLQDKQTYNVTLEVTGAPDFDAS